MVRRCHDPKFIRGRNHRDRGITVCCEWREDFWRFVQDVGPRPSRRHSIDRFPDNNGHYQPDNVRWATRSEQMLNTRFNLLITANGKTQPMEVWVRETGIAKSTIFNRLLRGWNDHDTVNKPARPKRASGTLHE